MSVATILRVRALPLALLGLFTSLYLSHHHIEVKANLQVGQSICSFDEVFDCDSVARSEYSELFGIPVAFLGAFFYASVILLLIFTKKYLEEDLKRVNGIFFLFFSISFLFSLYLASFSFISLGKICLFCSLLYVVNLSTFFLFLFYRKGRSSIGNGLRYFIMAFMPSVSGLFFSLGVLGLVILITFLPKAYEKHFLIPRYLEIYDKSVIKELVSQWQKSEVIVDTDLARKLPGAIIREVDGSRKGTGDVFTIVEFADYECPFCSKVAPILDKLYSQYKDRLELILLQFPLDNSCNRSIDGSFHKNSCRIAEGVLCASLDYKKSSIDLHERVWREKLQGSEDFEKALRDLDIDANLCKNAKLAIKEHIEFALNANVHSTPSIFVNGKAIKFNSFPQVETILKAIIEGKDN